MFGFGKNKDLARAEKNLVADFGFNLKRIPQKKSVVDLFTSMSEQGSLSHESQTALLYRLVAMNFLAASKLMRDGGKDTPVERLIWLTELLDRSVDWSQKATDHVVLEQITSQLNMNLERFLESFGIGRG